MHLNRSLTVKIMGLILDKLARLVKCRIVIQFVLNHVQVLRIGESAELKKLMEGIELVGRNQLLIQ